MKDNYPTRIESSHKIIKRIDKVAHWKPSELSIIQMDQYLKLGFVKLEGFYNNVIDIKQACKSIELNKGNAYINKEEHSSNPRSALSIHDTQPFKSLIDDRVMNIAYFILGGNTYVHQSRVNFKLSGGSGWHWHSDFETWHSKDGMPNMRAMTFMIPVDKNTTNNGCLNFLPKSHRVFISCPKEKDTNPESEFSNQTEGIPPKESIEEVCRLLNTKPVSIECNPGDLIIFDCNTLHYSKENITKKSRTNIYFVMNSELNKLTNPFSGSKHRPEEMAAKN